MCKACKKSCPACFSGETKIFINGSFTEIQKLPNAISKSVKEKILLNVDGEIIETTATHYIYHDGSYKLPCKIGLPYEVFEGEFLMYNLDLEGDDIFVGKNKTPFADLKTLEKIHKENELNHAL